MPHPRPSEKPAAADDNALRCVVDGEGRLAFVSPALGWMFGTGGAALSGRAAQALMKVVGGETVQGAAPGFHEVALLRERRDPLVMPARIDRVETEGRPLTVVWFDPDGTVKEAGSAAIGRAAQDLAARVSDSARAAEVAAGIPAPGHISTSDGELRHFLNLTNDMLGVYGVDLKFRRVNPAFNRVLGFADDELKTFPLPSLFTPEDRALAMEKLRGVLDAGPGDTVRADFECRARCKDGAARVIEWIVKAADGHLYIVGRDVTDMRRHEEELRGREAQLSEAQKIGRMGHWHWKTDGSAIEWSDQIYDIFGVSKSAFRPALDLVQMMIFKRDLPRARRAVVRALGRRKDCAFEFRLRRPDGVTRHIRCEGRCKIDPATGKVEAMFGILQDTTESTLREKALRAAKDAAEQSYAAKTRFLANMSHELRTPLNAIIGFSEMVQRQLLGPVGNPRYLDYAGSIRESGVHLLDLINDILDMSKIEAGKYDLHPEDLNVGKIMRLAAHMLEGRAEEGKLRVLTDGIADDIHLTADRRALMQILLNILSNAVKFTLPGGTITLGCQRELGGVSITVRDTGIGIPRDKIDAVVLPFEQVDSELTRRHEGTGLGLAITKDLIELHGGTLKIDSEQGVGTIVTVLLPEKLPEKKADGDEEG